MSDTRKKLLIMLAAIVFAITCVLIVFLFIEPSRKFNKHTIWRSSFSDQWGVGYNNYEYEESFPSVGIILVRSGSKRHDILRDRRLLANAIRQLRMEFGDAYRSDAIVVDVYNPKRPHKKRVTLENIHIVVIGDFDDAKSPCSVGVFMPAGDAFDEKLKPPDLLAKFAESFDCFKEIRTVSNGFERIEHRFEVLESEGNVRQK